jgi:hypothetical protein
MENKNDVQVVLNQAKRLASACYLVTNFIDDQDPLKWEIRQLSLKIVSFAGDSDLVASNPDNGQLIATNFSPLTKKMTSLLSVGLLSNTVSRMNFNILLEAFLSLDSHLINIAEKSSWIDNFNVSDSLPSIAFEKKLAKREAIRDPHPARLKGRGLTERQDKIVKYIKDNGWCPINEVYRSVSQLCGPKTVQRELMELARQGIVLKRGNKRWSRYGAA